MAFTGYIRGSYIAAGIPDDENAYRTGSQRGYRYVLCDCEHASRNFAGKTQVVMNQVDKMLEMNPLVKFRSQISGYSFLAGQGSSYGTIICRLKPWEEREEKGQDVNSVIGLMYARVSTIKDAQILIFAPPMIPGFSMTNGFGSTCRIKPVVISISFGIAQGFLAKLKERPEIAAAQSTFDPRFPQYMIDVDVAKCKRAGISPTDVLTTLQGVLRWIGVRRTSTVSVSCIVS